MKNEIEEIDRLIKETLSQEEAKFYDALEEQNIVEMLFGLFKGKNGWINILINMVILLFFAMLVYSGFRFFNASAEVDLIKWGVVSLALLINIGLLKLYAWMQMDKYAILRELKRLELQVMSLSGKLKRND